jgi:hypothetical protein
MESFWTLVFLVLLLMCIWPGFQYLTVYTDIECGAIIPHLGTPGILKTTHNWEGDLNKTK